MWCVLLLARLYSGGSMGVGLMPRDWVGCFGGVALLQKCALTASLADNRSEGNMLMSPVMQELHELVQLAS